MSKDNVNQPDHYTQGGVEAIDAITAATVNKTGIEAVCVANVIKYLWRYEMKNGVEDVKKAQWYLNRLVDELGKPETDKCDHVWLQELEYGKPTGLYVCDKCRAREL